MSSDTMSGQDNMSNVRQTQSKMTGRSASENVRHKRKRRRHVTNINPKASTCNMFTVEQDIYKGVTNYSGLVKLPVRRGSNDHFQPGLPTPGDIRCMFGVANICEQPEYSLSPTLMKDPDWQEFLEDQSAATRADEIAQWEERTNNRNTNQTLGEVLAQIALFNEHINSSRCLAERPEDGTFGEILINEMNRCSKPGYGVEATAFKEEKRNKTNKQQFLERENEIICKNQCVGYQNRSKQVDDRRAVWEGPNNSVRLNKKEKTADKLWSDHVNPIQESYNQMEKIHEMPVWMENNAIKVDKLSVQKSELALPSVKLNQTKHIESQSKKNCGKEFRIKKSNQSNRNINSTELPNEVTFWKTLSSQINGDRCSVQKSENIMPHKEQCCNIIEYHCSVESPDGLTSKNKCNHMGKAQYPVKYNWNTVTELLDEHIESGNNDCLYVKRVILAALSHISKTACSEDQAMLEEMRDKISATNLVNEIIGSYVEMKDKLTSIKLNTKRTKSVVRCTEDDLNQCVSKAVPTILQRNQGQYLTPTSLAIDLSSDTKIDVIPSTWEEGSFDEKVREAFHLIRRIDGLLQSTETERESSRANRLKGSRHFMVRKKCLSPTNKQFFTGSNEVSGEIKQTTYRVQTNINNRSESKTNKIINALCNDNGVNTTKVLYMPQHTDIEKEVKLFEPNYIAREEVPLIQDNAPSHHKTNFHSNSAYYFASDMFNVNRGLKQKRNKEIIKKKQDHLEQGAVKFNQSYNRFLTHSSFLESSFMVRALKDDLMEKAALYGITIAWPDMPYLTELDKLALFEKNLNCKLEATYTSKEFKQEEEQNKSEISIHNEDYEKLDSHDTHCNEEWKEDSDDLTNKRSREQMDPLKSLCQNNLYDNQSNENILRIPMLKNDAEALNTGSISDLSLTRWCSAVDLSAITQKSGWPRMSQVAAFFLLASIALGIISSEFYFLIA